MKFVFHFRPLSTKNADTLYLYKINIKCKGCKIKMQNKSVITAVTKPLKGIGNLVFGEGGESPPPDRQESTSRPPAAGEERAREGEEEAAVRLANAEIERAERAEREQRGQTLEMLAQMFPGTQPTNGSYLY